MGFVEQQIRRSNRAMRLWNGALLAVVLLYIVPSYRYLINAVAGPVPMDGAALAALDSAALPFRYFARVHADRVRHTGHFVVPHIWGARNTVRPSEFLVAEVGRRALLVNATIDETGPVYDGKLAGPGSDGLAASLMDSLRSDRNLAGTVVPVMLVAGDFTGQAWTTMIFIVPFGLLALWNLVRVQGRDRDITRHPTWRAMARLGGSSAVVAAALDREIAAGDLVQAGKNTITPSYLVATYGVGFRVARLADIVWLYTRMRKTATGEFVMRDGSIFWVKDAVDQTVREVTARVPWAVQGFSPENEQHWKKHRESFLHAVDSRRG